MQKSVTGKTGKFTNVEMKQHTQKSSGSKKTLQGEVRKNLETNGYENPTQ